MVTQGHIWSSADGLADALQQAGLERADAIFGAGVGRQRGRWDLLRFGRRRCPELLNEGEPIVLRHAHVAENYVRAFSVEHFERFTHRSGLLAPSRPPILRPRLSTMA